MPPEVAPGVVEEPHISGGPTAHAELEASEVKRLALRGVGALTVRTLGQRGLMMTGNIILARMLAPQVFGVYAIVSFVVGLAGYLSDLGMGAALIQRKEALTEKDLRTAFTLSALLNVLVTGTLILLSGPIIGGYRNLTASHVTAVRILSMSILFSTFSAIPSIRLERELKFTRMSIADLGGQIVYLVVTLSFAFSGFGVWCFVWGTLASRLINTVILNFVSPWTPRIGLDLQAMKRMMSFGLPFQLNGIVNIVKDSFIPTFLAYRSGATAVGYVVWAVGLATNSLVVLPIVTRITFPAYSRLQHDPQALKSAIEKSLKWVAATVFPATLLLAALGHQIVEHIYGWKWAPGLPSFYFLCIPMLNAAYSTVLVSALYGLGKAKTVLRLTVIWGIAGWGLGVPFTYFFGFHGFAAALSLVSCLSVLTVIEMNKVVKIQFVRPLLRILVMSAIPAGIVAVVSPYVVHNAYSLAALGLAGGLGYLLLMLLAGELHEIVRILKIAVRHA